MTQEQKDLLLQDLCARLPYGVKVKVTPVPELGHLAYDAKLFNINTNNVFGVITDDNVKYIPHNIEEIKPYLFPLLSMTEKQKEELLYNYIHNDIYFDDFTDYFLAGELWHDICVSIDALPELINWLNKNHFDYRGLIKKRLAIDATNKNIY